ncbi:hypothetical protein GCM10020229_08340 [Kitasatospora albolonga]|uniref:DUF6228 family protein n=1 Tax=Kitasatospora albolonga TaxID=68173 RepID=UPI0031E58D92
MAWEGRAGVGGFLGELLADFRPWEGRRVWEGDDRDFAVAAEFRSPGLVGLTWTVRPWRAVEGGWAAEVTTWVEAGAQLSGLAGELERVLS